MAGSEWFSRFKGKTKGFFRQRNHSSASLPNPPNPPPALGNVPQVVVSPTGAGVGNILGPEAVGASSTDELLSPASQPEAAKASAVSLPNLPVAVTQLDSAARDLPVSHVPDATLPLDAGGTSRNEPPSHDEAKRKGRARQVAWAGIKTAFSVLEASADAFAPLKSVIGGLNRCIEVCEKASKARENYDILEGEIDKLIADLDGFEDGLADNARTASIRSLSGGIKAELDTVKEKQERSTIERHLEALNDSDDIIECYRRIEGHINRLMLNANLNMWKTLDEEVTDRRLNQLSPSMSGSYNSWACGRTKRRECTEGTRVPELDRLKSWVRHPSSSPIYWMNGMAGTGKTTIAYTLCRELDSTCELAASFFCTRLLPECRNVQLIIPAIAYQLAQFSRPFRHALSKVLAKDQAADKRELGLQLRTLIANPLEAVQHTLPVRILVVIDALDECEDDDSVGGILDLLVSSTTHLPVRFLVSSRPEPQIYRRMMKQVGGIPDAKLVLHELDPEVVKHDIEAYVKQELRDVPMTNEQWKGVLERCGVLFIYASTACRFIEFGHRMGTYEEAVNAVLGLLLGDGGGPEQELNKLYTAILEAAFNGPLVNIAHRKWMKQILDTIICAQEPMTTEALAGLLELKNAKHVSALLQPLFSVVNVAEDTGIAATLHASFPDFMLSRNRSGGFYCAASEHHIFLTQACLKRIRENPVQFNICGIESSYVMDNEIDDLDERANRAVSPALFYACCHWTAHLELAGHSKDLRTPVIDFLSARLLLWMEVLNVKKCLRQGGDVLEQVGKWCQAAGMHGDVVNLANRADVFHNHYLIDAPQSTAHIYTSMLPSWPSSDPVAKNYIPRTQGIPRQQGIAVARRYWPRLAYRHMGEHVNAVCYYPDATYITAAVGNHIYILNGQTLQIASGPWEGHTDLVTSIAISPNGAYVASGSYDATIRVWNAQSGMLVTGPIKAHPDRVTSVAFSPDGTRLVSTGAYDAVRVWSVQNGERLASTLAVSEYPDCVRTAVFSSDGSHIVSGDDSQAVCFWNARAGNLTSRRFTEHSSTIKFLALSSDGSRLVYACQDGTMYIWDTEAQQVVQGPLKAHNGNITQATFSPDGMYIASCGNETKTLIWDANSGKLIATVSGIYYGLIGLVAFSPDSSRLVSCTDEGRIELWDLYYASRFNPILQESPTGIHSACFSSDGSRIATGRRDGSIWLWDTSSGELVTGPLIGHTGYICSVAISSNRSYIASASSDKTIRLWDVGAEQGAFIVLEDHTKRPDFLRFTPEGTQLLYGSVAYTIGSSPFATEVVCSPNDNDAEDEWPKGPPSDDVSCTASSPDGMYVAFGDKYGEVQLKYAQTGQIILGPLQGHTKAISQILFLPDGTHMVTCSLDDAIRFWPIPGQSSRGVGGSGSTGAFQTGTFLHRTLKLFFLDSSKDANTSLATSCWRFKKGGTWIVNDEGEHLVCLPHDLCPYLLLPENDLLISHRGSFTLDFTGAKVGKLWTQCYQPMPSDQ
ncbi:hypothetical protein B0J17DRAFT_439257 [Rhizoctonia solani]|nr:hypothetical protein B0J17DRAFT_439257 [Rhizoctonia solani]